MNKNKLLIVLIPVMTVIIIVTIFFANSRGKKNDNLNQNGNGATLSNGNTDETKDGQEWKNYNNEKYGFGFAYPADWQAEEISEEDLVGITVRNKDNTSKIEIFPVAGVGFGAPMETPKVDEVNWGGKKARFTEWSNLTMVEILDKVDNWLEGNRVYIINGNDKETVEKIKDSFKFKINDQASNISEWEKYDKNISFLYPKKLTLTEKNNSVELNHAVNYKHQDPCDFKGGAPDLEQIKDFNLSLKLVNKNLKGSMLETDGEYVVKESFKGDELQISAGFVDKKEVGSLKGYQITQGVEGCGVFSYYFPISENKTLVLKRPYISEFNIATSEEQRNKYLAVPGIIKPEEEQEIFDKILSSIKVK